MRTLRSGAIALALTVILAGTAAAGYCRPQPTPADITFTGVICQDPRLVGVATNHGETGGTFTLRFYSGSRAKGFPLRKVDIYVPAESSRSIKRWVKGRHGRHRPLRWRANLHRAGQPGEQRRALPDPLMTPDRFGYNDPGQLDWSGSGREAPMRVRTTTRLGTHSKDRPQAGRFTGTLETGTLGTLGTREDAADLIPHLLATGEPWEVFFPDNDPESFVALCSSWYEEVPA